MSGLAHLRRLADLLSAIASQNCQGEVVAGKAVAGSLGSATDLAIPKPTRSSEAFVAHQTLKVQQRLHVNGDRITVNMSYEEAP